MTWEQLQEVANTPGIDIAIHTYWHPDFKVEKNASHQKYTENLSSSTYESSLTIP